MIVRLLPLLINSNHLLDSLIPFGHNANERLKLKCSHVQNMRCYVTFFFSHIVFPIKQSIKNFTAP